MSNQSTDGFYLKGDSSLESVSFSGDITKITIV